MKELNDCPVKYQIKMAWGELDAFGHMNNTVYFRYFESARIAYFEELGKANFMSLNNIAPILAHSSCQFIKSINFPDKVTVGARVKSISTNSFVMEYKIYSEKVGLAAVGDAVIVCFDYKSKEKTPVPINIKESIEKLEARNF